MSVHFVFHGEQGRNRESVFNVPTWLMTGMRVAVMAFSKVAHALLFPLLYSLLSYSGAPFFLYSLCNTLIAMLLSLHCRTRYASPSLPIFQTTHHLPIM